MKPLKCLVVIFWPYTIKVYTWQNGDFLVADGWRNQYSWGMCITSAGWKTVITAVLRVKSGMDPHMISWDIGWFGNGRVVRCSHWSWNIMVLYWCVLLYFILGIEVIQSLNLNSIQMSMKFIKRFENCKGFSIYNMAMGQNPAFFWAGLASLPFSSHRHADQS
jgi:hypothetical protein